jgi:ribosomal protein L3 glutamine methyltransferase
MNVQNLIRATAARLEAEGVFFGHGSDNAFDEAAELVFFVLGTKHEDAVFAYRQEITPAQAEQVEILVNRRIAERVPAAYLTQRMWFGGLEFYVDARVLVPRSPIAELIESHFQPWIDPERVRAVVDIGTGSGCIAIATALAFPDVDVDAADVSLEALAVANINIERYGLGDRVRAVVSDVFADLGDRRYDIIVSNPPYVSDAEMDELPEEYRREPALGLRAGSDGLDVARRILAHAGDHLQDGGILIVEVGDSEHALQDAFPSVPFTWLEFERGGGGVFLLTSEQISTHAKDLEIRAK